MDQQLKNLDYASGFEGITGSRELAQALLRTREELATRLSDMGGIEMMLHYSDLTDCLIKRIFHVAAREAEQDDPQAARKALREIAIAAVGGYGRREMSPFSDVDVTFIVGTEDDSEIDLVVKRAFRILMDVLEHADLKVGYSYRRVDEVENLPLETQTALLDARWIAGNVALFNAFELTLRHAITPAAFVADHVNTRDKSGGPLSTPFLVEPNIKEGSGGLRDLHAARWIAQVAFDLNGGDVWYGLRARGIVSDVEIEETHAATEFIARTRNILHLLSARGLDVLSASRHAEVADKMGFRSESSSDPVGYISQFYVHTRNIHRIFRKVAEACLEQSLEIEPGVVAKSGVLHILDCGLLTRDPAALIRVFQHAQSFNLHIHRDTCDLIAISVKGYKMTPDARRSFVDLLAGPGAGSVLRSMADLGVLQVVIPAFKGLVSLVPGDAVHKFTVGEHSLRAVEQLDVLFTEDNEILTDVFSRVQKLEVLFLATLLHDAGKIDSKRDHARTGATIAAKTAAALGMDEDSCARVEFLVKHHLRMGETARLRDLNQRRTIRDFISVIKDVQLLDMLFLLTIADYRAVGTRNWSKVQIRFLTELHERAMTALRSPNSAGPDIDRHRSRVRRELCFANLPPDEVDEHCRTMPAGYLLNTPPEDLAAHISYVRHVRNGQPSVEIKDDRAGQFTLLTVVAKDRQGLLSEITGVLHAMNIDIHAAQIFTRHSTDDIAIDILYIDFEGRQLTEMKKWQLEGELVTVLSGQLSIDALLQKWGKKISTKPSVTSLRVLDNLSDHQTVVEVRATDIPGVLYYLTRKISEQGMNIHSARVATWGHEARDAFYLTNSAGDLLDDENIETLRAAL